MRNDRAPFMPVTPDIDDDKLDRLAAAKGVGALVKPENPASAVGQGASTKSASLPAPKLVADRAASAATPRERMKTINLELPDYVWTDLKIRAAHEQVSVRHIIMTALKGQGITIREADMIEDGRRLRGGGKAD